MPEQGTELLTLYEAGKRLRMGRTKLYYLVKKGDIRTYKIGRRLFISTLEIERFLSYCLPSPPDEVAIALRGVRE